jgi:hypothetical protein
MIKGLDEEGHHTQSPSRASLENLDRKEV